MQELSSLTSALRQHLSQEIARAGGWLGFDAFMQAALYTPGLGYYTRNERQFGLLSRDGSDFVTGPEMSPLFGQCLARQIQQALAATGTDEVWEFGAGSGVLALQLLQALPSVRRYNIVDISGSLRQRQRRSLSVFANKVRWVESLPDTLHGVLVGNEVLDAMPVRLLSRTAGQWHERGVAWREGHFAWSDRITDLRPPLEIAGGHDYLTEIHPYAEAFVRTLAGKLVQGAVFLIDYGFPENEYYHPQRSNGTLMTHRAHVADGDILSDVGTKDLTAHVNFSAIALTAQQAGMQILGYTSQARFLMNCGLLHLLQGCSLAGRTMAQKLLTEHEMGELFKVIAIADRRWVGAPWQAIGFDHADRTHTL